MGRVRAGGQQGRETGQVRYGRRNPSLPRSTIPTATLRFFGLSAARQRSIIGGMGRLFDKIRDAVNSDRFLVSWHADERCEERGIAVWQLAVALDDAELFRERPQSKPNPSVVVRQELTDGSEVEVIWAWMGRSERAKLVTVYFRD